MEVTGKIPPDAEALEELLRDPVKAKAAMPNGPAAVAFFEAYRKEANKKDPELQEQVSEAQVKGWERFMEEHQYVKAKLTPTRRLPVIDTEEQDFGDLNIYRGLGMNLQQRLKIAANGKGEGVALAQKFVNVYDFAETVLKAWKGMGRDIRLKNLGESQGDQGGFLVPEEFRAQLLMLALEMAVVRSRATVIPMARQTISMPSIVDSTHASTVHGGVTAVWVNEGGDVSSATNEPSFGAVRLDAKKLTAYTVSSNELLADAAIELEALLMQLFPSALAFFEDDAFINGVGVGQPVGILQADALISVAKETGQAANTIVWENIVKMFARMLPSSMANAVWIANNDTIPQLLLMSLNVGTGGAPVFHANGPLAPPTSILGRPVIYTEKAQTLGTAGDLYFTDLKQYLIGDRAAMEIAASPHVQFINDRMVWRLIQRVDGRPWLESAQTPRFGSNTLSPYVALATRA